MLCDALGFSKHEYGKLQDDAVRHCTPCLQRHESYKAHILAYDQRVESTCNAQLTVIIIVCSIYEYVQKLQV